MLHIVGGQPLKGQVAIGGAKNSMQFLVTSALLTEHPVKLSRIPMIRDIEALSQILQELNCDVMLDRENELLQISASSINHWAPPAHLAARLRSCLLFIPGLLLRFGKAAIPFPGGDRIGPRPLDTHFYILRQLGGHIQETEEGYLITSERLKAATLNLPFPSFTGTGLAMMLAAGLAGSTIIENAATEPELGDLARLLTQMKVGIEGVGTRRVIVQGNSSLQGAEMRLMPDRLEVGTLLMAVAATQGELTLELEDIQASSLVQEVLTRAGCSFTEEGGKLHFSATNALKAQDIETGPFPDFTTDLQPQFMALMTQAEGRSHIIEHMHTKRFLQAPHLQRMGAMIEIEGFHATVIGRTQLKGTDVEAQDIRGGASLVTAALAAEGETRIAGRYHLERGYTKLYDKLRHLGATLWVQS